MYIAVVYEMKLVNDMIRVGTFWLQPSSKTASNGLWKTLKFKDI